jgi:hypothetical protein
MRIASLLLVLLIVGCGKSRHEQYIETRDKYQDKVAELKSLYSRYEANMDDARQDREKRSTEFFDGNPSPQEVEAFNKQEIAKRKKESDEVSKRIGLTDLGNEVAELKKKMESLRD